VRISSQARGLLISLAVLAAVVSAEAAVEVISLNYRSAPEVLPLVRSMLSPEGRISADERTNSLIIVDSEEVIAQINSVYRVPGKNCWRNPRRSVSTLQTKTAGFADHKAGTLLSMASQNPMTLGSHNTRSGR
jgi:hypothetical protein